MQDFGKWLDEITWFIPWNPIPLWEKISVCIFFLLITLFVVRIVFSAIKNFIINNEITFDKIIDFLVRVV